MKCTVFCALGALAEGLAFHFPLPSPHVLVLYSKNFMSGFKRTLDVFCFTARGFMHCLFPESA